MRCIRKQEGKVEKVGKGLERVVRVIAHEQHAMSARLFTKGVVGKRTLGE